jgi:hypothetical protein
VACTRPSIERWIINYFATVSPHFHVLLDAGGFQMAWFWLGCAFVIANAAALSFYFALRLGRRWQVAAWLVSSAVIVLSPFLVPRDARPLRFVACAAAVTLLWKVYDAYHAPALGMELGVRGWVTFLPNWFWFVLRRVPRGRPAGRDWRRVAVEAPLMVGAVALCIGLLRLDWTGLPFALEHVAKVLAFAGAMLLIGQTFAALYRRLVGPAMDPFDNPFMARTPADFWRRWNRPFRDFFDEYVFRPSNRARRPVFATLTVFALSGLMHEYVFGVATGCVQGWQMLFFMVQGCAVAATLRLRPRVSMVPLWWAGTLAFNLVTALLFFRSVDEVIAFYQR